MVEEVGARASEHRDTVRRITVVSLFAWARGRTVRVARSRIDAYATTPDWQRTGRSDAIDSRAADQVARESDDIEG